LIGDLTQPFTAAVNACCHNISEYISKLDDQYSRLFQASPAGVIPSCRHRENFHLFDDLFIEEFVITPNGSRIEVKLKLFLPKTGCSRVLSYSMFIEPIVALRDILKYDQLLELSFLASILVTPVLFHHVVMKLVSAHKDQDNDFLFCAHPFYDVLKEMIWTVNDGSIDGEKYNWQSFFKFRFRTSGGEVPFPTLFGAQPKATKQQRQDGERTLSRIVGVLFDYTEKIDNTFMGKGRDPVSDMPISSVKEVMSECVGKIAEISKCQFQMFRLGVFTTILSGAGLLQPGPHLHQLLIPVKDTGSFKHLTNPSETEYAQKRQFLSQVLRIEESQFDRAMAMIASKLGIRYERGIIETLLVSFRIWSVFEAISLNRD